MWKQTVVAGRSAEKAKAVTSGVICHSSTGKHTKWHKTIQSRNLTLSVLWVNSYSVSTSEKSQAGLLCGIRGLMKISQIKTTQSL